MKFKLPVPLLIAVFSLQTPLAFGDLRSLIESELQLSVSSKRGQRPSPQLENLQKILPHYHGVLIGGLFGELMPGYFRGARKTFKNELQTTVTVLQPKSSNSVELNAELLYSKLLNISRMTQKPLLILAHSKAGPEIVLCLLKHPDLIFENKISHVVVIQGALGGSPVASEIVNRKILGFEKNAGIQSLIPSRLEKSFTQAFQEFEMNHGPGSIEKIGRSLFYVRSQIERNNPANLLIPFRKVLKGSAPENDGLVPVQSQLRPELGQDLGILDADHADLVASALVSNTHKKFKHAFIRALMRELFEKM